MLCESFDDNAIFIACLSLFKWMLFVCLAMHIHIHSSVICVGYDIVVIIIMLISTLYVLMTVHTLGLSVFWHLR